MSDRIVGILGGMGPEATVDLYREIIRLTPARRDQDHIRVIIDSNAKIPDRTEAILSGGADPLPYLVESALLLENAGAGILAVPCNAAHYFLPALQARIHVHLLDMIEETCRQFETEFSAAATAGLLGTTGTVQSGIYQTVFERRGVHVLVPDEDDQRAIQSAIQQVKAGAHGDDTSRTFESTGARLVERGAHAVILGCTEIPLAFDTRRADYPTLNPSRILAQAAVDWALGSR